MTDIYKNQREPLPIIGLRSKDMAASLGISQGMLKGLVDDGIIPCLIWKRAKIFIPEMVKESLAKFIRAEHRKRSPPSDPSVKPDNALSHRVSPPQASENLQPGGYQPVKNTNIPVVSHS